MFIMLLRKKEVARRKFLFATEESQLIEDITEN